MSKTRPSNRLAHGLCSRYAADARRGDAGALAIALRGDAPVEPPIAEASVRLAEAILQLNAVRSARLALFERSLATARHDGVDHKTDSGESRRMAQADHALTLQERAAELRRLENYERKATSRQTRLMNRLDYLMLEARRSAS